MAKRFYYVGCIFAAVYISFFMMDVAEKNAYFALSVVWIVPKLADFLVTSALALLETLPWRHEQYKVPTTADQAIAKKFSNFFDRAEIGLCLNSITVLGTDWLRDGRRVMKYDYWKSNWKLYLVITDLRFDNAELTDSPALWIWVRALCSSSAKLDIIEISHVLPDKWKGIEEETLFLMGKSRHNLDQFVYWMEDQYNCEEALQVRVSRRTPLDLTGIVEEAREPLLNTV